MACEREQDPIKTKSNSTTEKPKRRINRPSASCSGCRKRKTRCDRGRPCSECLKRNLKCDYSGAISPPILIQRKQAREIERDEYIKTLEARLRALEQNLPPSNHTSPTNFTQEKQDFSADDLAAQLSTITIGQRVRCNSRSHQPHPLQLQIKQFLSSRPALPRTTFIQPEQQFSLNLVLVASDPLPSLEQLCYRLPSQSEIEFLSEFFFTTTNLWSSCLNRTDWKDQFNTFYNSHDRLQFRPSPPSPDPPHLTQHYLAQFLSTVYAVIAHGILALADIHHLDPAHDNTSNCDPSALNPGEGSLWNLGQAEQISLANRWFKISLGLLVGPLGDIYVKPTVYGVRAMSALSNVELAPENIDHGIFFWTLTCNVATTVGLFREPPISDDETSELLDETEIESRRCLAWHSLSLDWAGHSISGGIRPRSDPDQFFVKLPGTVPSATMPLHPIDGWPLDPLICVKRIGALNDCLLQKANNSINSGQLATYEDILKIQKQSAELEQSIPPRLKCRLSADGKSLEPVVKNNPIPPLMIVFLHSRFCISRIRLLRLFIFPKKGVPPQERFRQIKELLRVSKEHFLAVQQFSHTLNMHPLLIYSLINTAVACALTLLINHQTRDLVIDEAFFLAELHKVNDIFNMGKKTMAATMASKAVSLLQTLVSLIETRVDPTGYKSLDGRKKGPGLSSLKKSLAQQSVDIADEARKHKKPPNLPTTSPEPSSFQSFPFDSKIPSHIPRPEQQTRHEPGFLPNQSFGSSQNVTGSAYIPVDYSSSSTAIHHAMSNPMESHSTQTTPPLFSPHPLQRPALSNSSSSSHLSPRYYPTPEQVNITHALQVAPLPHYADEMSNLQFGSMDPKSSHHPFNFSILNLFSSDNNGVQLGTMGHDDRLFGDSIMFFDAFNPESYFQTQPTTEGDPSTRGLEAGNITDSNLIEPFQPAFHLETTSTSQSEGRISCPSHHTFNTLLKNMESHG